MGVSRGNTISGQQDWEVLRGKSASERVSERTSEREGFRGFQRFLEVFRGFERFSEVFQRPSQRPSQSAIFLSELRVVLPLIVLPLNTPANHARETSTKITTFWVRRPPVGWLSSLGFEERNLGCPGNFTGMSRTPGGVQKFVQKKVRAHFSFPMLSTYMKIKCKLSSPDSVEEFRRFLG